MFQPVTTSGLLVADAAVLTGPGYLHAVTLIPAAADSSVVVYDNTAASGTVLTKIVALANTASVTFTFNSPVCANSGLYADVSGASAGYILHYSRC